MLFVMCDSKLFEFRFWSSLKNWRWTKVKNPVKYPIRSFLCSDQIDHKNPERLIEPKQASYIDALIDCTNRASKIASISEIEKYWKYAHKNQVIDDSRACNDYFWTSNKPINNSLRDPRTYRDRAERTWTIKKIGRRTACHQKKNLGPSESSDAADLESLISHSISGHEIQKIYLGENTLINTQRIPLATFENFKKTENLELITNPDPESDSHSCICVMYEPRKVHKSKVMLREFRFYPLQGRRRTADEQTSVLRRWGKDCYELFKAQRW